MKLPTSQSGSGGGAAPTANSGGMYIPHRFVSVAVAQDQIFYQSDSKSCLSLQLAYCLLDEDGNFKQMLKPAVSNPDCRI